MSTLGPRKQNQNQMAEMETKKEKSNKTFTAVGTSHVVMFTVAKYEF